MPWWEIALLIVAGVIGFVLFAIATQPGETLIAFLVVWVLYLRKPVPRWITELIEAKAAAVKSRPPSPADGGPA